MRLLTILLLFSTFSIFAQTDPITVHLRDGKVISTKYVYLYSSYSSYVRIHDKKGEKIKIDLVEHIEGPDEEGNYRYIKPVTVGNNVWAERSFTSDRIVLYHTDIVMGKMAASHKPKNCLYSKDGAPLKPVKLKYLKKELADFSVSMEHIKKAKKVGIAQAVIYTASVSLIVGSFAIMISNSDVENPDEPESTDLNIPPTIIVGAIGAWVPFFMNNKKTEHCINALKAYE